MYTLLQGDIAQGSWGYHVHPDPKIRNALFPEQQRSDLMQVTCNEEDHMGWERLLFQRYAELDI